MHTSFEDLRVYPPEGSILIMDEDGTPVLLSPERDYFFLGTVWAITSCPLGFVAGWLVGRFIS